MKSYQIIIVTFISILSFYGAIAFTLWDYNPGNWSIDARYFMSSIGIFILIMGISYKMLEGGE